MSLLHRITKKFQEISTETEKSILEHFIGKFFIKTSESQDKLFTYSDKQLRVFQFTWLYATVHVLSEELEDIKKRLEKIENK